MCGRCSVVDWTPTFADVEWSPAQADGGTPITAYLIQYKGRKRDGVGVLSHHIYLSIQGLLDYIHAISTYLSIYQNIYLFNYLNM